LFDSDKKAIDWLAQYSDDPEVTEQDLRSFMGKMLFRGDAVFKPVNVLSGGEKARMVVSRMMMEGGNVLILDEPTNHLDLESIESLNYALSLVEETVIFVSHDREFVNSLATRIIEIRDGVLTDYPGTLDEYEDWKRAQKRKAKKR
jgi:ATPase subunit of ABC transporter with duplicated ATPase domains